MSNVRSGGSLAQFGTALLFGAAALSLGMLSPSRPLAGVAGYVLLGGAGAVVRSRSGAGPSSDARPQTPAGVTLALIGLASAVVFPALVTAEGLGHFTWTPLSTGVALAVAVLYAIYGVVAAGMGLRGRAA
jgi:hypothetical protein